MSVTIIIAAYNAAPFINRAIASALAQTLPALEILIVDDGSTDMTRAIVEAAVLEHPCIRLIALPRNAGPSAARNAAIREAKGIWLAVLDADDAFAPTRLATLLAFAEATNADFVADDLALYDAVAGCVSGSGFGRDEVLPEGPIGLRDYLAHNLADGRGLDWGLLKPFFRRSVLYENAIAYDENISHGEDFKLVVDLLMRGATFRLLAQPLYLYTQRSSGMSRTSIGYGKLKAAALALAEDSRIAADAELVALLRRRARGLGRLDDAHFLSTALRQGALGRIALRSFRDLSFMPFMLVQIARALRRRLRIRGARGHGTEPRGLPYR